MAMLMLMLHTVPAVWFYSRRYGDLNHDYNTAFVIRALFIESLTMMGGGGGDCLCVFLW